MDIIKCIIADDHKVFRSGLKMILSDDPALQCIAEAGDGLELLAALEKEQPDVVLTDLKMPNMDGAEAVRIISSRYPEIKVVVLTMMDEDQYIIRLMEYGASGYLLKNADPDEIKKAIHQVHETGHYFNDLVSRTLLGRMKDGKRHRDITINGIKLTDKEVEVIRLICMEHTATEIGEKMFLSRRTVEGIKGSLLEKTGARNTAGLVLYAVKEGVFNA